MLMGNDEFQEIVDQFEVIENLYKNDVPIKFDDDSLAAVKKLVKNIKDLEWLLSQYDENKMERCEEPWEDWEISLLQKRHSSNVRFHCFAKVLGRNDNEIRKKYIELNLSEK